MLLLLEVQKAINIKTENIKELMMVHGTLHYDSSPPEIGCGWCTQ